MDKSQSKISEERLKSYEDFLKYSTTKGVRDIMLIEGCIVMYSMCFVILTLRQNMTRLRCK